MQFFALSYCFVKYVSEGSVLQLNGTLSVKAILCSLSLVALEVSNPKVMKSEILWKFLLNLTEVSGKWRSCRLV